MKRKFLFLALLVIVFALALTACGKKDDVELESIKANIDGVKIAYQVGENIDLTGLTVTATYSDGETKTVALDKLNVGTVDTSTAGTKTLVIEYDGVKTEINIVVSEASSGDGGDDNSVNLIGALAPANVLDRNSYKADFTDSTANYYVGDDNAYIFSPQYKGYDESGIVINIDSSLVKKIVEIYAINEDGSETLLEGDALAAIVSIDLSKDSYDFTEAAIGKVFKIRVRPEGNNFINEAAVTISHVVEIVDAYNVHNAYELNVITNYDADLNDTDMEGHLSQLDAVNRFLADKGITRPEILAGVVIHSNFTLKESDLPAEYIYDANGSHGFYDYVYVYHRALNDTNPEFTFYGNYYTIYTNELPCVVEKNVANNGDQFSSASLFKIRTDSAMFKKDFDLHAYRSEFLGLGLRDDTPNSNDVDVSKRSMLGLIGIKVSEHESHVTNTNITAFVISMLPEYDYLEVNLHKVKFYNAWQGHLFLWSDNALQGYFGERDLAPYESYQNLKVFISESSLTKCGGPVIMSQNDNREYACNLGNASAGIPSSSADIIVDDKTVLESYVTGTEAWFAAVGHTATVSNIAAMSNLVSKTAGECGFNASYLSDEYLAGTQMINLILINMGTGTTIGGNEKYCGTLTIGGVTSLNMTNNPMLDMYQNVLNSMGAGAAPIYQTTAGGTAFCDGETGCYGIETGAMGAPTDNFFDGDYITMYVNGMGIVMEYYNSAK